jgi:hypothetical protein
MPGLRWGAVAGREQFPGDCDVVGGPALISAACTSWQDRVDALGRGLYRRYDERTATMVGDTADMLIDRWGGDLRRPDADADVLERRQARR